MPIPATKIYALWILIYKINF